MYLTQNGAAPGLVCGTWVGGGSRAAGEEDDWKVSQRQERDDDE